MSSSSRASCVHTNVSQPRSAASDSYSTTTLAALIADLCELLGVSAQPVFGPPRPGDVHESTADIAVATELLGYFPDVDLATGLRRTTAWISGAGATRSPAR